MIVRAAEVRDLEAIKALHIDSWQRTYRGLLPEAFLDNDIHGYLGPIWHPGALEGRLVVLAEHEGLLGFAVTARFDGNAPYLNSLHVARAAQGKGVGRALLRAVAQGLRARGLDQLSLDVLAGNDAALAAYLAMGGVAAAPVQADCFGHPVTDIPIHWSTLEGLLKK